MADLRIITDQADTTSEIELHLRGRGGHSLSVQTFDQVATNQSAEPESMIVDCNVLHHQGFAKLLQLRKSLLVKSTLVLAKQIPIETYRNLFYLPNIAALQKPFPLQTFDSVLNRLDANQPILPSRFPRFKTDESVRFVELRSGLLIPSRMKNYSVGGAFLEYRGVSLQPGDKIQLGFTPNEFVLPKNSIQLKARVIWVRSTSKDMADRGVGVQFLEQPAPIKNLRSL